MPTKLATQMNWVQTFYADQMEDHGYGRVTFRHETNADGDPLVRTVIGKFDDGHYHSDANVIERLVSELQEKFGDLDRNIYLISLDVSTGLIGGWAGLARGDRGPAVVPSVGRDTTEEKDRALIAHELGHAFGLPHDFRDGKYIMSWGSDKRSEFSDCSATLLSVNRFLTETHTHENTDGTIEMLSPTTYIMNRPEHKLKFRVSDPDRIHKVLLEYEVGERLVGIVDCQCVANRFDAEVTFDMPADALKAPITIIWVHIIDPNGFKTAQRYNLRGGPGTIQDFTYLTLQYEDPHALMPINLKVEWDWNGWIWEKFPGKEIPARPHDGFIDIRNFNVVENWEHWFYSHATGELVYDLTLTDPDHRIFDAYFHLPNPCGNVASVKIICKSDNTIIYQTQTIKKNDANNRHIHFTVPENTEKLKIKISDGGNGDACDHFILANAKLYETTTQEAKANTPLRIDLKNKLTTTWAKMKINR